MRQYVSPADLGVSPAGQVLMRLFSTPGLADRELARASAAADDYCRRKLGMNGSTTLAQAALVGDTSLKVADVRGFDENGEGAVLLDVGGAQEQVMVLGVQVQWPTQATTTAPPYPGTLLLQAPLAFGHAQGAPAQGLTVEKRTARGGSTNTVDFGGPTTQEQQIAEAHAPHQVVSDLVRVIFCANRPIQQIIGIQVVQRWGGTPYAIAPSNLYIDNAAGFYRLPLGTFVPQGSNVITTYTGGYGSIPDAVQEAVVMLAADNMTTGLGPVVFGLADMKTGQRTVTARLRGDTSGKSILRLRAEAILDNYMDWTY